MSRFVEGAFVLSGGLGTMSGPLRVFKFHDSKGKTVAQQIAKKVHPSKTFKDLCEDLYERNDRTLVYVEVAPDTCPNSIVTAVKDEELDESVADLDAAWACLKQGTPLVITFILSDPLIRVAPAAAQPTNAFSVLLAASRTASLRTTFISSEDVEQWLDIALSKGQLAQATQQYLQALGAGFMSSKHDTLRKDLFLAVNNMFWHVTPDLSKSFSRDLVGLDPESRAAFNGAKHLMGAERAPGTKKRTLTDAVDKLVGSLKALTTSERFRVYAHAFYLLSHASCLSDDAQLSCVLIASSGG